MAAGDTDLILARLEGFLKAFEWFNHKTDHVCTFDVYQIPKASDVPTALASYFRLQPADFRTGRLADFERELRAMFARFLFLFREPAGGHKYGAYLIDPRQAFELLSESGREKVLDELAGVARSLGPSVGWRVAASLECGALREWCF